MPIGAIKPVAPSEDKRWRIVHAAMRRNGFRRDALIETLHTVQESFGYVDDISLRYVAQSLRVPLSAAYGVITFYHFFSLKPPGQHTCVVCTGTACYIKQANQLLQCAEEKLHILPGETTPDGLVSLLTARCVGSCGIAPVVVIDGAVEGNMTPERMTAQVTRWRDGQP